jgi:hypothetical protein
MSLGKWDKTPTQTPNNGGGAGAKNTRLSMSDFMDQLTPSQAQSIKRNNAVSAAVIALGETTVKKAKAAADAVRKQFATQDSLARLQKKTSEAAAQAAVVAQEAAEKEAEALAQRESNYKSFADSVKNTFAGIKDSILGAFDIGQLGGSTDAITRNMEKLLVKLRSFATNVKKLSGMGLDPALLQQVISAGPLAGAQLAQTLVSGGANALASINAGYSEFGMLAGQIAQTGTQSRLGNAAQQNVYNIEVGGGVGSGATIGQAIVDAIKSYERTSGAVWQRA